MTIMSGLLTVAIVSVVPSPVSIVQSSSRSAFGCGAAVTMRPLTTSVNAGRVSISSTGKPRLANRATIASTSAGRST